MEKLRPQVTYEFADGNNKLATLRDVNEVIDTVNELGIYSSINLIASHPLGSSPTFEIVGASAETQCPSPECTVSHGDCICITFTNIGSGVYSLTVSNPVTKASIIVGSLKEGFYNAGVEQVSNTEFLIKTYNIAIGAYEDNLLENTYIELKIWE